MSRTLRIKIKQQYAVDLIEDLITVGAIELVEEEILELTGAQKMLLTKNLS